MRLVQKHAFHTGYAILEINEGNKKYKEVVPTFTKDYLIEAEEIEATYRMNGIDATLSQVFAVESVVSIVRKIQEFKGKYGVVPQNYTEELRTGFSNCDGLLQTLPRYLYK